MANLKVNVNENQGNCKFQMKKYRGTGPDDPIPTIDRPNFESTGWGRRCMNPGSSSEGKVAVTGPDDVAEDDGPSAGGVSPDEFVPCRERQRPKKRPRGEPVRVKRAETYASDGWYWQDPTNIPYRFHTSFPNASYVNVRKALAMWSEHSCLDFDEVTETPERPHIVFKAQETACATLRLGPNNYPPFETVIDANLCNDQVGSLAHEIGHALGLTHTQKRVDRDDYVTIFLENVPANWTSQFERNSAQYFDDLGVPYYYDSIMQYYPKAASADKRRFTICPLDPLGELVMGQREEPAFGDIALINRMYCPESCFSLASLGTAAFDDALSTTISGRICQKWTSNYPHRHKYASVGDHNYCRNPDNWSGGPWCYTSDPTTRYEPCFSACEKYAAAELDHCEGWCQNGGYHNPETCKCECPEYAKGAHCETVMEEERYNFLQCGGRISLLAGIKYGISSPNWPAKYAVNQLCMWWIEVPEGFRVRLEVGQFQIEEPDSTGCYDYLEVRRDLCDPALKDTDEIRYCGDQLSPGDSVEPFVVLSDETDLVLKFYSDESEVAAGFNAIVSAVEIDEAGTESPMVQ